MWYELRSLGLGAEFLRAVDVCFERIRRSPESFQLIYKNARRARITRFPYVAYFVSAATGIQIVACMHAKRDPRIWRRRVNNPAARSQLAQQLRPKAEVDLGREVESDHRGHAHVGGEEVLLHERDPVGDAGAGGVLTGFADALGVEIDADAARAVLLGGGDHDAPVAAAEIVDDVGGADLRGLQHRPHHLKIGRHEDHVQRGRHGRRHRTRPRAPAKQHENYSESESDTPFERRLRRRNRFLGGGRKERATGERRPSEGGQSPPPSPHTLVTMDGDSSPSARSRATASSASCSWWVAKIRHWATLPGRYLRISVSGSFDTTPAAGS